MTDGDDRLPGIDAILAGEPEEAYELPQSQGPEDGPEPTARELSVEPAPGVHRARSPADEGPPDEPDHGPEGGRGAGAEGAPDEGKGKEGPEDEVETASAEGPLRKNLDSSWEWVRERIMTLIPEDPIDLIRFKLRWLGVLKFPVAFLAVITVTILLVMYLWHAFLDYDPSIMLYSREVPVIIFLIPVSLGIFSAIYFGINKTVVDGMERALTDRLEDMVAHAMMEEDAPTSDPDPDQDDEGPGEGEEGREPEKPGRARGADIPAGTAVTEA